MKSERLKKLEAELEDLEQWQSLGLVPKAELARHHEEIQQLQQRIEEERDRLRQIRESGDAEEFVAPRRSAPPRAAYPDSHSMPDGDFGEEGGESSYDMDSDSYEGDSSSYFSTDAESGEEDSSVYDDDDASQHSSEEEDPFSDRNRWRRGPLEDPDVDRW